MLNPAVAADPTESIWSGSVPAPLPSAPDSCRKRPADCAWNYPKRTRPPGAHAPPARHIPADRDKKRYIPSVQSFFHKPLSVISLVFLPLPDRTQCLQRCSYWRHALVARLLHFLFQTYLRSKTLCFLT